MGIVSDDRIPDSCELSILRRFEAMRGLIGLAVFVAILPSSPAHIFRCLFQSISIEIGRNSFSRMGARPGSTRGRNNNDS